MLLPFSCPTGSLVPQERQSLLDKAAVSRTNHISGFAAWRVGVSGKRFKIMDVDLVNIVDRAGEWLVS